MACGEVPTTSVSVTMCNNKKGKNGYPFIHLDFVEAGA